MVLIYMYIKFHQTRLGRFCTTNKHAYKQTTFYVGMFIIF